MTRVLLIEDNPRDAMVLLDILKSHSHLIQPVHFQDPFLALNQLQSLSIQVDMVITPIELIHSDGVLVLERLTTSFPNIPIILLSPIDRPGFVREVFKRGVRAYLSKGNLGMELMNAILHVEDGRSYISPELALRSLEITYPTLLVENNSIQMVALSQTQRVVLRDIAKGLTNSCIGERLFMSKRTVEGIRSAMLLKTGTHNTASLLAFAFRNGLLV